MLISYVFDVQCTGCLPLGPGWRQNKTAIQSFDYATKFQKLPEGYYQNRNHFLPQDLFPKFRDEECCTEQCLNVNHLHDNLFLPAPIFWESIGKAIPS